MKFDRDRQFYRTKIPFGDAAVFRVGASQMPIREISERGIRYDPAPGHAPEIEEQMKGVVVLETVGEFEVSGRFLRVQEKSFVVLLDAPGIPHDKIIALQQLLMRRSPKRP